VFTGGAGGDTFVFATIGAAGNGTNRDQITDFATGDVIDVGGIDANGGQVGDLSFDFIGAVTNVVNGLGQLGRGQLGYHYETDASGVELTIIEGNVNANAAADFQIDLRLWRLPDRIGACLPSARPRLHDHPTKPRSEAITPLGKSQRGRTY
jgi:Ca2+-binding RTX toxin-like protein